MTGGGVWDDMPTPPWPAEGELPAPGDTAFDALLDRAPLPDGATAPLHQLAAAFSELYAAPVDRAPAAEQYAVAMFRAAAGQPAAGQPAPAPRASAQLAATQPAPARPGRRRARRPRFSYRVAAIGAAVVVSLSGAAAAAAYTGALPAVLHRLTPHHPASPAAGGRGPDARG